jgi:hypothetical protein
MRLAVFLTVLVWLALGAFFLHRPLHFDDAYMFYRYAVHMHGGFGMAWNINGGHTFGETSLLWGWFVWLLTFLPLQPGRLLIMGSWLWSGLALGSISAAVAMNSVSLTQRRFLNVFPQVAIPLLITPCFVMNGWTGMETMMALALNSLYAGLVLSWINRKAGWPWIVLVGFAAFLARPESGILVVTLPVLAAAFLDKGRTARREMLLVLASLAVCLGADLAICRFYFGYPLPLSFYAKGLHRYDGFLAPSSRPLQSALEFLGSCGVFWIAIAALARRQTLRMCTVFLIPLALTIAYLLTVLQVMGFNARYYVPYYGLVIIPGLLLVDEALAVGESSGRAVVASLDARRCFALASLLIAWGFSISPFVLSSLDYFFASREFAYDQAVLTIPARVPLPVLGRPVTLERMGEDLLRPLPQGVTFAATEIGYPGAAAPQVNIIDMAALNDDYIAFHGFDSAQLLARQPDLIWMPLDTYTHDRASLFADPELLRDYIVYAGAFDLGLAVRKQSPFGAAIDQALRNAWQHSYPGYDPAQYIVQKVEWSGRQHRNAGP